MHEFPSIRAGLFRIGDGNLVHVGNQIDTTYPSYTIFIFKTDILWL